MKAHLRTVALSGIFYTLNWRQTPFTEGIVNRLFGKFLENALDLAATFDRKIGQEGINTACGWLAGLCGAPARSNGVMDIPQQGPVLLVSNHPGYFDSMVIAAKLPRQDLKVIAGGVHYFEEFPNASQYLLYITDETNRKVAVLRSAIKHLKAGGCVLIFPTGRTDPDPDALPGALERLDEWSDSVALMMRQVPETKLVPTVVSGILNPRFLRHLIVRIQPTTRYRARVAELLQMVSQFRKPNRPPLAAPRVTFGRPITGNEMLAYGGKPEMMRNIRVQAVKTLTEHQLAG